MPPKDLKPTDTIADPVLIPGGYVGGQPLLEKALAALRPFANLPIFDGQPDEAHPAFQVKVEFVREARACFPEDFPVKAETTGLAEGEGETVGDGAAVFETESADGNKVDLA